MGLPPLSRGCWLASRCPLLPYPPPTELKATGTAHFFNFLLNTSDYRILFKDEDHDRMYVGSKDYVLSLDLHDINREPLIVRARPDVGRGMLGDVSPRVRGPCRQAL